MSRFINTFKALRKAMVDPQTRALYKVKYTNPHTYLSTKKVIVFATLVYTGLCVYWVRKYDDMYALKLSLSRRISVISGHIARVNIPKFMRRPLYSSFARLYQVNLEEIIEPLDSFENFLAFFTRKIHPRPVDQTPHSIVSPADSKVLCFSEVTGDECLIVKGINYKLGELVTGEKAYKFEGELVKNIKTNPDNKIYQCILYLAPGDYHRFHSPVGYTAKKRIHIYGRLKPVKENYVKTHTDVYEKNERVSLFGEWEQGKFCMVFVGALNVGSIELNFDPELRTNTKLSKPYQPFLLKEYEMKTEKPEGENVGKDEAKTYVKLKKGEELGRFNLGSTIVLLFEADPSFKWNIQEGQTLKYGQLLGKTEEVKKEK